MPDRGSHTVLHQVAGCSDLSSLGNNCWSKSAAARDPARPAGWDIQYGMDVASCCTGAGSNSVSLRQSSGFFGVLAWRGDLSTLGRGDLALVPEGPVSLGIQHGKGVSGCGADTGGGSVLSCESVNAIGALVR